MKSVALTIACTFVVSIFTLSAHASPTASGQKMDIESLKEMAFQSCQSSYVPPKIVPVDILDPPKGPTAQVGLNYQAELAVTTKNLLDRNGFYFSPRPRAAVNKVPMDIFVDTDGSGSYHRMTWEDADPNFSSPIIQPPVDRNVIPSSGKILTELIVGHLGQPGDYPQLFDIRSSAYFRFAGFPPMVTGASLRLGAHGIFGHGKDNRKQAEDFPIIRSIYASAPNPNIAHAFIFLENSLFCGALDLDMIPRKNGATVAIDSYWYTRRDFNWKEDPNTALVAYSSMYWKSATAADPHGAAHDSDTFTVRLSDGRKRIYPLSPPLKGLQTQDLSPSVSFAGWSIQNNDRNPSHYSDFSKALGETNYNLRASYNVEILDSNVTTGVSLYQMAADGEYGDNIVGASTIRQNVKKSSRVDQFIHFKYSTSAFYPADQCDFIREGIQKLPASGGIVKIPQGTFNCSDKIVVKKSHVQIQGAGQALTILRLADQSSAPVLVVGDDQVIQDSNGNWVTKTRLSDVTISELTTDGNVANQDTNNECGHGPCSGNVSDIRNNGITIRGASNVTIKNVTTRNSISGGLVTEKYCDHLLILNFTSYGNHFDGLAGYQTTNSRFQNVNLSRNSGAGISIDIDFKHNSFLGGIIADNKDVGIFARDIEGVVFEKLSILRNANHGVFLAGYPESRGPNEANAFSCAQNNTLKAVTIKDSAGFGVYVDERCQGNSITGFSRLEHNKSGCSNSVSALDSTTACLK